MSTLNSSFVKKFDFVHEFVSCKCHRTFTLIDMMTNNICEFRFECKSARAVKGALVEFCSKELLWLQTVENKFFPKPEEVH